MRVGHGVTRLEIPVGTPLGGYADRTDESTGTSDPLEVHAITVNDSGRRWALVVVDAICVNIDLAAAVASTARDEGVDETWTCATHTHSGPETGCHPRGATTPEPWTTSIQQAARTAVALAVAAEEPARLEMSTASVAGVASVRRLAHGEIDLPVDVVRVQSDDGSGRLVGVLAVLHVHPTVLPASNTLASADLHGAVRRALAIELGHPAPWVTVATGAAGDISTRGVRRGRDLAECDRLAGLIATAVVKEPADVTAQDSPAASPPASLSWSAKDIIVRGAQHSAEDLARLSSLLGTPAQTDPLAGRRAHTLRQAVGSIAADRDIPAELALTVHVLRVGSLRLVGLPGEPFLGLRDLVTSNISLTDGAPSHASPSDRASSDGDPSDGEPSGSGRTRHTPAPAPAPDARPVVSVLLGYVNGYMGYLPTVDAFSEPSYETVISPVAPGESERVLGAARAVLVELDRTAAATSPLAPTHPHPKE